MPNANCCSLRPSPMHICQEARWPTNTHTKPEDSATQISRITQTSKRCNQHGLLGCSLPAPASCIRRGAGGGLLLVCHFAKEQIELAHYYARAQTLRHVNISCCTNVWKHMPPRSNLPIQMYGETSLSGQANPKSVHECVYLRPCERFRRLAWATLCARRGAITT